MAHVGKIYPHIERLDFRFPDAPWAVPPKLWIVDGVTLSGNLAHNFPPCPWEVGLTSVIISGKVIRWRTILNQVGPLVYNAWIDYEIRTPLRWAGCVIGVDQSNTIVSFSTPDVDPGNPIEQVLFAPGTFTTHPASLKMDATGFAVPKQW